MPARKPVLWYHIIINWIFFSQIFLGDRLAVPMSPSSVSKICYVSMSACWKLINLSLALLCEIPNGQKMSKILNSLHSPGTYVLLEPFLEIQVVNTSFFFGHLDPHAYPFICHFEKCRAFRALVHCSGNRYILKICEKGVLLVSSTSSFSH